MKRALSLILAAFMAFSSLLTATGAVAADSKSANVAISVYDGGFVLEPTIISVSADLSTTYFDETGYDDESGEPTFLDAFIAASLELYGKNFTETAPLKVSTEGWDHITSSFGKETSSLMYNRNGSSASGLKEAITDGDRLEIYFMTSYNDAYVALNYQYYNASIGDDVTLKASYTSYDSEWNPVINPASDLKVLVNGEEKGTTNGSGAVTIKVDGSCLVSLSGEIGGNPIVSSYCVINTELATYVDSQIEKAAAKLYAGKESFTADDAMDFYLYMCSSDDYNKYVDSFCESVKANLDANEGKLVSSYTGKEDIGLYGGVINCLDFIGENPESFEGYNIVSAFEAVNLEEAVSNPYFYADAIAAAYSDEFAHKLCDDLVNRFYVMGKGLNYWGFNCDNTCYFITALADYADEYAEQIDDAKAIIKSYTKENGAYCDNTYVTDVNADSTALAAMAFSSAGDYESAYQYYIWLTDGFEEETGIFGNDYATKDALRGLLWFKRAMYFAEIIAQPDHVLKPVEAVPATCTAKGNGEYYRCLYCSKCFSDKLAKHETTAAENETAINPAAHNFSDNAEFCKNGCGTKNPDYKAPAESTAKPTTAQTPEAPKAASAVTKLTLKKVAVKKSAKKLVLQATLKVDGKAVKGKKITFKFNGKKYTAKTNKKGIAKVTIKKSVLKKLKKGKKITIKATYGKKTAKRTVKVK